MVPPFLAAPPAFSPTDSPFSHPSLCSPGRAFSIFLFPLFSPSLCFHLSSSRTHLVSLLFHSVSPSLSPVYSASRYSFTPPFLGHPPTLAFSLFTRSFSPSFPPSFSLPSGCHIFFFPLSLFTPWPYFPLSTFLRPSHLLVLWLPLPDPLFFSALFAPSTPYFPFLSFPPPYPLISFLMPFPYIYAPYPYFPNTYIRFIPSPSSIALFPPDSPFRAPSYSSPSLILLPSLLSLPYFHFTSLLPLLPSSLLRHPLSRSFPPLPPPRPTILPHSTSLVRLHPSCPTLVPFPLPIPPSPVPFTLLSSLSPSPAISRSLATLPPLRHPPLSSRSFMTRHNRFTHFYPHRPPLRPPLLPSLHPPLHTAPSTTQIA